MNRDDLHPDSQYLLQDNISLVIAKGLAVVYKEKPENPVEFHKRTIKT